MTTQPTPHTTAQVHALADREAAYQRFLQDVEAGRALAYAAHSERSVYGYQPVAHHRNYANAVAALATYAATGDRAAAAAHAVLVRLPLYNTRSAMLATVAEVLLDVHMHGYDDVVRRSGPEAGRHSDHQHPTTLQDAADLVLLYAEVEAAVTAGLDPTKPYLPGLGWCWIRALADDLVRVPRGLPRVAAAAAKATEAR